MGYHNEKYQFDKPKFPTGNEHINAYKMAHCIGVAEYMRERAKDYGLNPDKAYTMGLLHDIGYLKGRQDHEKKGAELLLGMGMDEDIIFAVSNHDDLNRVISEYGKESITPELALMVEGDMSVNAQGYRLGFEGRLQDIEGRYGHDHAAYRTVKGNMDIVKEYCNENGIKSPDYLYEKGYRFIDEARHKPQESGHGHKTDKGLGRD